MQKASRAGMPPARFGGAGGKMTNTIASLIARRKIVLVALGLPVLVAAWWAFRPEKLFINEHVNEPAPFLTSSDPQPVLTGPLEDGARGTVGRATIYKTSGGRHYLRIAGLSASDAQLRVVLKGADPELPLGALRSPSEQNFDLPASIDLNHYDSVAIYSDQTGAFAIAKLQPF
jgi:hypothetical protein